MAYNAPYPYGLSVVVVLITRALGIDSHQLGRMDNASVPDVHRHVTHGTHAAVRLESSVEKQVPGPHLLEVESHSLSTIYLLSRIAGQDYTVHHVDQLHQAAAIEILGRSPSPHVRHSEKPHGKRHKILLKRLPCLKAVRRIGLRN